MAKKTAVGIDIGTYQIKVVVASQDSKTSKIKILGTGFSQSKGIRHGYIVNKQEMTKMPMYIIWTACGSILLVAFVAVE